jgi:hypothetical protein
VNLKEFVCQLDPKHAAEVPYPKALKGQTFTIPDDDDMREDA